MTFVLEHCTTTLSREQKSAILLLGHRATLLRVSSLHQMQMLT